MTLPIRLGGFALFMIGSAPASSRGESDAVILLDGVPSTLSYPLPAGTNLMLTARVRGGTVESVWLAPHEITERRVPLQRVAEGEYQLNLADRAVQAVAAEADVTRQLYVFARLTEPPLIKSLPICYALLDGYSSASLELTVIHGEQRTVVRRRSSHWFVPEEVRELLLSLPVGASQPALSLRIAEQPMAAESHELPGELRAVLTDEIRHRWKEKGTLDVVYQSNGSRPQTVAQLYAIPRQLDASASHTPVTIHQRRHKNLPGTHGFLRLELDDITAGRVLVTLRDGNGQAWIDAASMRAGDALSVKLDEGTYVAVLTDMVNLLTGDDYATFEVRPLGEWQTDRIERLLQTIEASDVIFIREGEEYSGREAGEHLRRKLDHAEREVHTLDDFIEHIASRSSTTGNPYHVRLSDGTTLEAGTWMRERTKGRLVPSH